jgi:hypothetical protein
VADAVANESEHRHYAQWWEWLPLKVAVLEGASLREDRSIRRLATDEISRNPDLRAFTKAAGVQCDDVLMYMAHAEGRFGRYRLVAIFLFPPDIDPPRMFCLDGPRGADASEHRNSEVELCLYYKNDPDERRWKSEDGLRRLFDLGRRHVTGEYIARMQGKWPIEEAPHGQTEPAAPDPSLLLPRLRKPGRNEPCTCGSGRKSKKCCWR